jgi:hypothetical protein
MNSMKRSVSPRSRKYAQRSKMPPSFTPRWTTQLILTGRPAATAASMPRSTRSRPRPRPLSCAKVASSSESTLMLRRSSPASRSSGANFSRNQPLVVSATSGTRTSRLSARTISGTSGRNSGSPPVRRIFSTPSATNTCASRVSSPGVMSWPSRKNACPGPNTSAGMQ